MAIALMRMEGFDDYIAGGGLNDLYGEPNGQMGWNGGGAGPIPSFVAGRYVGITGSQALFVSANSIDDERVNQSTHVTGGAVTLTDGNSYFFGANVYMGAPTTGAPTGYHRVFTFCSGDPGGASGAGGHRLTVMFNTTTGAAQGFQLVKGSLVAPIGATGILVTGTAPTRNPWQQWTYIECELHRAGTTGRFNLWVETATGGLEQIFAYTGDTSEVTIGEIKKVCFGGSKTTGGFTGFWWDDFWGATGGRPGKPCYVLALKPIADVAGTGVSGFAASSGADHYALVNDIPVTTGSRDKFVYNTVSASGTPIMDLFSPAALPYTPANIYGVMAKIQAVRSGVAPTGGSVWGHANIRKGATDYPYTGLQMSTGTGALANLAYNLRSTLELDPDTGVAWTPAGISGIGFGPASTGMSGGTLLKVHSATLYVLASQEVGVASTGAGGAAGGQPFWMVQTG